MTITSNYMAEPVPGTQFLQYQPGTVTVAGMHYKTSETAVVLQNTGQLFPISRLRVGFRSVRDTSPGTAWSVTFRIASAGAPTGDSVADPRPINPGGAPPIPVGTIESAGNFWFPADFGVNCPRYENGGIVLRFMEMLILDVSNTGGSSGDCIIDLDFVIMDTQRSTI